MFIHITKEELTKEILKKAWYQTNNIIFTIILVYPLFSIIDFIYESSIWLQFFIVRIITVVVIYALYTYFNKRKSSYRILLHITFFLLSVTAALECSLVHIEQLNIYFLLYSVIILFINLQAFWEAVNSVIQVLLAMVMVFIFYKAFSSYELDLFISNGVQFFII